MHHPHQLHAAAALWSLRRAAQYLAEHRETVLIHRPQLGPAATRPRSLAALTRYDDLLRAERAERPAGDVLNGTAAALGGGAAPVAPGLLDLEREIRRTLDAAAATVRYVRQGALLAGPWPATASWWEWFAAELLALDVDDAATLGAELAALDHRVRAIAYAGRDLEPLPGGPPCPACGERRLRWQTSAPHWSRWTVVCVADGCVCRGDGETRAGDACTCGMPVRVDGVRHIWPGDQTFAPALRPGRPTRNTAALAA